MVPHVAARGHSFKGAGLYYLHDKKADTSDRVAWTYTYNLPTQDPEKAMKWMAYTAKNADQLKQEAGIPTTGRKAKAGSVYSFSLSWHPEQEPKQGMMLDSALDTLELLGLKEHEAVIVAHRETDHPHVHVICNLVNPQDGRTAVPSYDRLKLSRWAEEQERKDGKIYCEQRVQNNAERRRLSKELVKADRRERQAEWKAENERTGQMPDGKPEVGIVKDRDEKLRKAEEIQMLYTQSDNGKAFNAALEQAGYTLAQGNRRGFVLVDGQGNIHSLSRQLKGQRAKDIKARLSDIDQKMLPQAKELADERRHFDRDQYEIERQKQIVDAAIEEEKAKDLKERQDGERKEEGAVEKKKEQEEKTVRYDDSHLRELDALRAWEKGADQRRHRLQKEMEEAYEQKKILEKIAELEEQVARSDNFFGRVSGKRKALKEELAAQKALFQNTEERMAEQKNALELKLEKERETFTGKKENQPTAELEAERQREIAAQREHVRQMMEQSRNRKQGRDFRP